jgi:hypothetical protein
MTKQLELASAPTDTAIVPLKSAGEAFLEVIAAAARDPQVDVVKMQQLLEMRERIMAKEAEIAFNEAMARLQPNLPRIQKTRAIMVKGQLRSKYAALEDIDAQIRPFLLEEGFAVSYSSEPAADKNTKIILTLRHRQGHKEQYSVTLPFDQSEYRTQIQSQKSTLSFGERTVLCMALNIITVDEDDDGEASGYITEEQINKIRDIMFAMKMTPAMEKAFFSFAQVSDVEQIQARDFDRVMTALKEKWAAIRKKMAEAPTVGV